MVKGIACIIIAVSCGIALAAESLKWKISDKGMSSISNGIISINDNSSTSGSSVRSSNIKISSGQYCTVSFEAKGYQPQGRGSIAGVYLVFYTSKGADNKLKEKTRASIPASLNKWKRLQISVKAPADTKYLRIWIHSFNSCVGKVDIRNFQITRSDKAPAVVQKKKIGYSAPTEAEVEKVEKLIPEGLYQPCPDINDRAFWKKNASLLGGRSVIRNAERKLKLKPAILTEKLYREYKQTGSRKGYETLYRKNASFLSGFILAECIENKGRFLPQINTYIKSILNEKTWVIPAHDYGSQNINGKGITVDLGAVARGNLLSSACKLLGNRLEEKLIAEIDDAITTRIIDPYLTYCKNRRQSGFWWVTGTNNWNAVCNNGVVYCALTMEKSRKIRAQVVANALKSIKYYINDFPSDGYCSEGIGYWDYGFGNYLCLAYMLERVTSGRINMCADPKIRKIAEFSDKFQFSNGKFPTFADNPITVSGISPFITLALHYYYSRPLPNDLYLRGNPERILLGLDIYAKAKKSQSKQIPPEPRGWFPVSGILVSRSGKDGIAIKGGNNAEHHNHNDIGSYVVVFDRLLPCCDPGKEIYTARTFGPNRYDSKLLNSWGHPVPLVAGKLQKAGRHYYGKVLKKEFTTNQDSITIDLKKAYDVKTLTNLDRTLVFNRKKKTAAVTDRFAFSTPEKFGTAIVTYCNYKLIRPDTLLIYNTEYCSEVKIKASEAFKISFNVIDENNGMSSKPYRIGIDLVAPARNGFIKVSYKQIPLPDSIAGVNKALEWKKYRPDEKKAIKLEAEKYSSESGGKVVICKKGGDSGESIKFWNQKNQTLNWNLKIHYSGSYAVRLRYCSASTQAVVKVTVQRKSPGRSWILPGTGGWGDHLYHWKTRYLSYNGKPCVVKLSKGQAVISLKLLAGAVNLDWLELIPVKL